MDTVTVYTETVYNSSNSMNSTRNLNKNRKKSNVLMPCVHESTLSTSICSLSREKCTSTMEEHCCVDFGSISTVAHENI